jgi:hypothetical protein
VLARLADAGRDQRDLQVLHALRSAWRVHISAARDLFQFAGDALRQFLQRCQVRAKPSKIPRTLESVETRI